MLQIQKFMNIQDGKNDQGEEKMEYKKNLIPGIVLTLFAISYLAYTTQIEKFTGSGSTPLSARFIPYFWGSCLLLLSMILVIRGIKQRKQAIEDGIIEGPPMGIGAFVKEHYEVLLTFGFLTVYIALMESVGFLIMTILFLFGEIIILTSKNKRNYLISGIVAVVFAFGIDFIFVRLLNVLLPLGIFGF